MSWFKMCGIAGFFGNKVISQERINLCLQLMKRRGPDDSGVYVKKIDENKNLYLLQTRLSIIDLNNRSKQPFCILEDALAFNGEIYNYKEFKKVLETKGVTFKTTSDTEVLARSLSYEGLQALDKCEGMWSFAWYESKHKRLYLCRDRFGEKPLYIFEDNDGVYFGSEPKFIFTLLGRRLPVNKNHILRFIVNGYKSLYKTKDTFFSGMFEVDAGCVRSYESGKVEQKRYWKLDFNSQIRDMSFKEATNITRDKLISSVELRLRADVPIAFCLSGGVDSNSLIAIAKRELGFNVHGFTVVNTDTRYEEKDMVDLAVRELNLEHTNVGLESKSFIEELRKLIIHHDAPIYTITYFLQWKLMQEIANQGYKVSVSGTAADEIFSGYYDHHNAYLAVMSQIDVPHYELSRSNWLKHIRNIVRNPFLIDPDYFIKSPSSREHIYLDADSFSSTLIKPFDEPFSETEYCKDLLRNRMANELFHESVPVILHEDDSNSMYYSVENRSPFLDRSLVEFSQTIPTKHLIKNGFAKAVLRDAVSDIAPSSVIFNPRKVGFNAPIQDLFDLKNVENKKLLLQESPIFDLINFDSIQNILEDTNLTNSKSKFLFNFLCSKIFLEEYQ